MATSTSAPIVSCPFCDVTYEQEWSQMLVLHIQNDHAEDNKHSEIERDHDENGRSSHTTQMQHQDPSEEWVACPEMDCEEFVLLVDLSEHLDLHEAADSITLEDGSDSSGNSRHRRHRHSTRHNRTSSSLQDLTVEDESARISLRRKAPKPLLGTKSGKGQWSRPSAKSKVSSSTTRSDVGLDQCVDVHGANFYKQSVALGPYASEKRMPPDLYAKLKAGPKMIRERTIGSDGHLRVTEHLEGYTPGLIKRLADVSAADPSVQQAWFCHPAVQHVHNLKGQGGFCGYRNVQMQMSYMQGSQVTAAKVLPKHAPTVIEMQDWIEKAWDEGINDVGRAEVGILKGTRKWIGTSEASAIYSYLGIPNDVWQCSDEPDRRAHRVLFEHVLEYFDQDVKRAPDETVKIYKTSLPPVYLQQPGHSLTIVGFERHHNGHSNLLVFDCMYDVPKMLLSKRPASMDREGLTRVMEVFRRGGRRLHRYKEFELLKLAPG